MTSCDLSVPARIFNQDVTVTVNYYLIATGGAVPALGFSFSNSATASIPAFCGKFFC